MGHIPCPCSGICEMAIAFGCKIRAMVVGSEKHIHPFKALQQIESLAFQLSAFTVPGSGVHCNYHDIRVFTAQNLIHAVLHEGKQRHEVHSAELSFAEPGTHIGIGKTEDSHLQACLAHYGVVREIRLPVIRAQSVAAKPGDAV